MWKMEGPVPPGPRVRRSWGIADDVGDAADDVEVVPPGGCGALR